MILTEQSTKAFESFLQAAPYTFNMHVPCKVDTNPSTDYTKLRRFYNAVTTVFKINFILQISHSHCILISIDQ